jgi:hypothetical protein
MSPVAAGRRTAVQRVVHGEAVLVCGDVELARWPLRGSDHPDLALVEEVARWHLAARHVGCAVRVRDACPELQELIELIGLDETLERS